MGFEPGTWRGNAYQRGRVPAEIEKKKKEKEKKRGPPKKKLFGGGNFYGNLPNGSPKGGDKNWRNYPKKNKTRMRCFSSFPGSSLVGTHKWGVWGWGKVGFIFFSKLLSIHWSNANWRPFLLLAHKLTPKKVSPIIRTNGWMDFRHGGTWLLLRSPHMLGSLNTRGGSKSWGQIFGWQGTICLC